MENIAVNAGRKLFAQHIKDYTPEDPYYETYTDDRGRERRRKRELPPGLSHRDAKILKSVKIRAHYLDKGFRACGMRFGWTFIIGIVPGAGDVADAALNYLLVVSKARQAEIPDWLLRRMLLNNAISAVLGFIPLIGDVILASYKANSRNAILLEEFLRIRGAEGLQMQAEAAGQTAAGQGQGQGAAPQRKSGESWFARRTKSREHVATTSAAPPAGDIDRGRFVEDVPAVDKKNQLLS